MPFALRNFIIANKKNKPPKKKKCKICDSLFEVNPFQPLRGWCSPDCGYKYSLKLKANKEAKEKRDSNKELKVQKQSTLTHSDYIQLFQKVFNTYIRFRDKNDGCISCGTRRPVNYDAGHFYPTTYQFLRFNEDNVHKQCSFTCNKNKSGNLLEYRPALIKKIGLERVLWLDENRHKLLDITIPELIEQIKIYKLKIKQLKAL